MTFLKSKPELYKGLFYSCFLTAFLYAGNAFGSNALEALSIQGFSFLELVLGPIGLAVILFGSIAGFVICLFKGQIWGGVSILILGVLFVLHIENIRGVFN